MARRRRRAAGVMQASIPRSTVSASNGLRGVIAAWPLEAIVNGIAVFEGKKKARTLPEGVDARYLRRIVKSLAEEAEGWHIAEALLRERLAAQDLALRHLDKQRDDIEEDGPEPVDLVKLYIDKAIRSARGIDRTFWLLATADAITDDEPEQHRTLLRLAARRIHANFAAPHRQRLAATRLLFAEVLVID